MNKERNSMEIDINELTVGQIKEIKALLADSVTERFNPYPVGTAMLLRTVTMIVTGRVLAVGPQEIVLEDAAWIADTGRYHEALRTGVLKEVEPYPAGPVVVGRGAIIDGCVWAHALPRSAK